MAITASDVVTDDDFANVVEQATEASRGFREVFRPYPVTPGEGPTVDILEMPDGNRFFDDDDVESIGELSEYPRADPDQLGSTQVEVGKEGFETAISDEAVARGKIDEQLRLAGNMATAFTDYLDNIAGSLLLGNLATETAGDNTGDGISWSDLVRARTILRASDRSPTHLIHEPQGTESLLLDSHISDRSTGMADSAIRTGGLPPLLGLETVEVTTGLGPYEAVMVDRSRYGHEAEEPLFESVRSYRLDEKDGTAYKLARFKGYKVMDSDSAVKING